MNQETNQKNQQLLLETKSLILKIQNTEKFAKKMKKKIKNIKMK